MKLPTLSATTAWLSYLLVSSAATAVAAGSSSKDQSSSYVPIRVSYDDLKGMKKDVADTVLSALSKVGMISITGVPSFRRSEVLASIPPCANGAAASAALPDATRDHTYDDGVRRRTVACHKHRDELFPLPTETQPDERDAADATTPVASCDDLHRLSGPFRDAVTDVTDLFATLLSGAFPKSFRPLKAAGDKRYKTFADAVYNGDHLEHFHTYERVAAAQEQEPSPQGTNTIEWHTDQGLFIVFTPGQMEQQPGQPKPSGGFYIQLPQDEASDSGREVQFDEGDDLVIMLGDGIGRFYPESPLRPVPHAFRMPREGGADAADADAAAAAPARAWYGRMVLPPADALLRSGAMTFGELRDKMGSGDVSAMAMGCSSSSTSNQTARELEMGTCASGESWCWHRCMSYTEYGASPLTCSRQGKRFKCADASGAVWPGNVHNDSYKIRCSGTCNKLGSKCTKKSRLRCCRKKCSKKGKCF